MKLALPLAVEIANSVADASQRDEVDVRAKAIELIAHHPEAEASFDEVSETLEEELDAQFSALD